MLFDGPGLFHPLHVRVNSHLEAFHSPFPRDLTVRYFPAVAAAANDQRRFAPSLEMLLRRKPFVCHKLYLSYRQTIDRHGG